jgi:probable O-glycosylation ligase (exosortase A-associated)
MRDVLLVVFMLVLLPAFMWRPVWGTLAWVWWGIMNPHRLAWGFAQTIPFAQAIFAVTVIGALFSREPKKLKGGFATFVLLLFVLYISGTTFFALVPDRAWPMLERAVKVQLGTLLTLLLLYRKEHVIALIWTIALSIGFYAVKGGLFTIATLGQFRVWGPEDTFIADNNAFALATVMSIPLWAYLYGLNRERPWIKLGIVAAIGLSAVSAIGSHSRGAVVAIVAMGAFLWWKSKNKLLSGALMLLTAIALFALMPQQWEERVTTITDPRAEASANSRLETWTMLWNLAVDRPLTGGGFEAYSKWIFEKYNPTYDSTHAAHSIYFQVLGEHGFIALTLFLLFWVLVWRMCSQVARVARGHADDQWAYWLAQMIKVSVLAYLVGGTFQNLAYWDMPYYLFVAVAVTRFHLKYAAQERAAAPSGAVPDLQPAPTQFSSVAAPLREEPSGSPRIPLP